MRANKIEDVRVRSVDKVGRSGGLAILWKHPFDRTVTRYSSNFIDVEVCKKHGPIWRLTGFYGYPGSGRRRDSWDLLRTLARDNSLQRLAFQR